MWAALSASRHAVVSTRQLRAEGLSRDQVSHLAAAGFLHPRHRGVWAVGRPDISFQGACLAATLACGEGAAISHITSAAHFGYRQSTGRIHVSGPRTLEGHPGLVVHRPRSLPPEEIVVRDGIPTTCVGRTLLDMAAGQRPEVVSKWIHEADVQGVIDMREVWRVLQAHPHHRGRRALEAATELEVAPTRSGLEDATLDLVLSAGLPEPLVNSWQWSGEQLEEVDFCWPAHEVIVEVDGGRFHRSRWRRRRDAAKDGRFRDQGWIVERIPEMAIALDPAGVAATIGRGLSAHSR